MKTGWYMSLHVYGSGTRAHSKMQLENHVKTKQCTKLQASKPCCEKIKFKTKFFKIVNEDAEKCVKSEWIWKKT